MTRDNGVYGRARRRLTAFLKPHLRHHRPKVRPPHTGNKFSVFRDGHVAVARAAYKRQSGFQLLRFPSDAPQQAQAARVRIYGALPDAARGGEAQLARGVGGERAHIGAGNAHVRVDFGERALQADGAEVGLVPPVLVAQKRPLAHKRAKRARRVAARAPGQEVGEVKKEPCGVVGRGKWRSSQRSLGVCISGDNFPPT